MIWQKGLGASTCLNVLFQNVETVLIVETDLKKDVEIETLDQDYFKNQDFLA